jgi:NitT/TauT family transport system ATP-binding protein
LSIIVEIKAKSSGGGRKVSIRGFDHEDDSGRSSETAAQATAPALEAAKLEPLPAVTLGEVLGVMEVLKQHAGEMDVFALDEVTDYDFGRTLSVVKAGEMLEFLDTPGNGVLLTETGQTLLAGDTNARKELINRQLRTMKTFQFIVRILGKAEAKKLPKEVVLEEFAMHLPSQDPEQLFETMVGWARYAELFGYEPQAEMLYLDEPDAPPRPPGEDSP